MTNLELKPLPPSTNHMYGRTRFGGVYKTARYNSTKQDYGWLCKAQTRDFYTCPITLEITAFFGDKRRHDADNIVKVTQDSLTGILWEDDSQISDLIVRKRYSKENPRLELRVYESNL